MSTQTIEFRAAAGLTLTAELFAIGSDSIVDTESATEQTNRAGTYRAIFTDVAAGEYQLVAFSGTVPVASWLVTLTLATATFQVYDRATSINMVSQPLDASGVRSAVGLASANLDTQLADIPTVAEFEARSIPSADYFDAATDSVTVGTNNDKTGYALTQAFPSNFAAMGINVSGHVERVTLVDTTTTNTDMRGTDGANTTTPPTVSQVADEVQTRTIARVTLVDTVTVNTDMRGTDNANTTTPPTVSQVADEVQTRTIARVTLVDTTTANTDMRGTDNALLASGYTAPANSDITAIKTKTDQFVFTVANQVDSNALSGSGGGDATEAKQDQILAALQGVEAIQVPSPNILGNLVLTQGDTYDGIGNPKAQWNVTNNYTDGWAVVLTIRDKDDAVVYTTTGTVDSATLVSVAITTPTVAPMVGCPGYWEGKYDVQLSKAGSVKTIALGKAFVNEDQTR